MPKYKPKNTHKKEKYSIKKRPPEMSHLHLGNPDRGGIPGFGGRVPKTDRVHKCGDVLCA